MKAGIALSGALAFGVVTQVLFWDAPAGVNVVLFTAIAIAANAFVRKTSVLGWVASGFAVLGAGSIATHDSDWSLLLGLPTTVLALVVVVANPESVSAIPTAVLRLFGRLPYGTIDAARTIPSAVGADARPFVVRGLLGVGLGLPIAGIFGGLLSTDESFRNTIASGSERIGTAAGFVTASIATAFGALVVFGSIRATRTLFSPSLGPYRGDPSPIPADAPAARPTLSIFTWGVVLAQVAFVFGIFAIANVRHLFGGVASIHAEKSLTYAAYLHSGFAELVIAALASIGLVIVGHVLVTPHAERAARGGRALIALEIAVLSLSALTLASCAQRLFIYEDAYGATYRRLGVFVVGLLVLSGLIVTGVKSIRRGWSGWGGAATLSVLAVLAGASLYDADNHVARTNLDRAASGKPLDVEYLATLGPDARATLDHPALSQDDRAMLDRAWQPPARGWRSKRW